MEYVNGEVDGALNAQKIRGESSEAPAYIPTANTFHVNTRLPKKRKEKRKKKKKTD